MEIDKFGFGKYQRCIWTLCGFGYFLDLAWAQGVALMTSAVLYVRLSITKGVPISNDYGDTLDGCPA